MAKTTVSYERTGLDTSTGNRSAARMAGGVMPDGPLTRKSAIPEKNFQEMFQDLTDKQAETKRVKEAAEKARNAYESGTPAPLNSAGSQTIADAQADRTLNNTASTLKVTNQGYADRENINLANERAKKASGLGQYNGTQGGVVTTTYANGSGSAGQAAWMAQMAAKDRASEEYTMALKAASTAQSQVDANRAVGLENAQTQKYAATVAANAQRDAAAFAMMGQFAGQGGYKYWGG